MRTEDFVYLYEVEDKLWWFVGMREIAAALLDDFCPQNIENILDIGCGTGLNLKWLERYAKTGSIKGLDVEKTALDFCRARGENFLTQGSATDLPFPDACFDLVTSFDVLVQIPGEKADEKAIAEMHRVLKPKGVAFVRAAAYEWMRSGHDKALNTQRRYTVGKLSQKLEKAGFTVLRKTYANALPFPLAVVRRLILKPVGLSDKGSDVKPFPPSMEWLNRVLTRALLSEAKFLKRPNARFPFGLSAICVVRKD
ncbi:MAG TPA: class I SAM-dependent methyltransferase [Pyrinomonadaceae bacterium]|jgi:ubiquinone/menaquinone biosynthesis C-methylase UbiE